MRAGAGSERTSREHRGRGIATTCAVRCARARPWTAPHGTRVRSMLAFSLAAIYSFLSVARIDPTLAGRGDEREANDSSPMPTETNATSSLSPSSPRENQYQTNSSGNATASKSPSPLTKAQLGSIFLSSCASTRPSDWTTLCAEHLVLSIVDILVGGDEVHVVQIGAHVGFERNDPIAGGLSRLLDEIVDATKKQELRRHFHWTFVEPSPPNFHRLATNMMKHSNVCDMKAINEAVVPDNRLSRGAPLGGENAMTFYSIRDTIDPETGFDALSKKNFPHWVSQISSFSKETVFKHQHQRPFKRLGLDMKDYVMETNVSTKSYTDLLTKIQRPYTTNEANEGIAPLLVLIDTEGLDCDIVEGISPSSPFIPAYLIFEHKHCQSDAAVKRLKNMGYITHWMAENVIAVKQ